MVSTVRRQVDQHLKGCVPRLLFFNLVEVQADANAMGDLRSLTDISPTLKRAFGIPSVRLFSQGRVVASQRAAPNQILEGIHHSIANRLKALLLNLEVEAILAVVHSVVKADEIFGGADLVPVEEHLSFIGVAIHHAHGATIILAWIVWQFDVLGAPRFVGCLCDNRTL